MKSQAIGKSVMTRRVFVKTFIKTVLSAGVVALVCSLIPVSSWAETREYILIGHPAPMTGPIAVFGETATFIDEFAAAEINSKGGIFVKDLGKKLPIKFVTVDTESNPTKAADIASKLILKDKVDVMILQALPTPSIR